MTTNNQEPVIIELIFNKSSTRLAGNPFGKSTYDSQVSNKIDFSKLNIIHFPDNIERVASSFVQGFFSEIINHTGYDQVWKRVEIESIHDELKRDIYENLFI